MHNMLDNLQVSEVERTNAVRQMEKACLNAYHAVLEKERMLAQQVSSSESEYNKICDILGEKELKHSKIKVSYRFLRIRIIFVLLPFTLLFSFISPSLH